VSQNIEKRKARQRKYYLLNRERMVEKTKKWQKKNPLKVKKNQDRFRLTQPNWRKDYYKNNPDKYEQMRFKSMMWRLRVKLSFEEFKKLLKKQKNKCAICGKIETKRRISVDHCHKTGKVRGLLCQLCNTSLGGFQDDIKRLERAIVYLNNNKK
jgi:hypothetical protein